MSRDYVVYLSWLVDIRWTMAIKNFSSSMNGTLRFNIYIRVVNSITFIANGLAVALGVPTQHGLLLGEQFLTPALFASLAVHH